MLPAVIRVVGATVLLAAAGCTAPASDPAGRDTTPAPSLAGQPDCFFARDAQDFRALDRSSLLVFAPNRQNAFRVTVSPPSFGLRNAVGIAFAGGSRICGQAGERLLLDGGGGSESLAVIDVRRLDPAALDATVGPPGGRRAVPPPQPGPGAAIESDPGPDAEASDEAP